MSAMIALSTMLDWTRMAQPQSDQYDTEAVLRRAPSEHSPGRGARLAPGAGALICDGAVTVQTTIQGLMSPPRYVDAVVDHPNLPLAADLLRHWPAAYQQFKRLVDTVHPLCDTTITVARRAVHLGASSGSDEARLGTICVTVDCVLGLAQAMVQQMAHQKLRALDISDARASRFIQNDLEMRVTSPFHGGAKHSPRSRRDAQYPCRECRRH